MDTTDTSHTSSTIDIGHKIEGHQEKRIREAKTADASAISGIYKYYVDNTAITFETVAPSEEEMAGRIKKYTKKYPWIVMEDEEAVIGYAYASSFRERVAYRFTVEISVYLSKNHCSKGYGRILAESLLEELEKRGFYTVIAGITATNQTSIRLFEKLGFRLCADFSNVGYKNEEWLSVLMMSKSLQPEYRRNPPEPEFPIKGI